MATGKEKLTLTGHSSSVWSVAFSPDGKTLASGSWDNSIIIWDLATGKKKLTLTGHSSNVRSVAFSPNGKSLASGSNDNSIIIWDLTLYSLFFTNNNKPTPLFFAFADGVEFIWGKRVEGLEIESIRTFNPRYKPLLNPPTEGQDKFDQILEWAKEQVEK